jgi:hypothetical protein
MIAAVGPRSGAGTALGGSAARSDRTRRSRRTTSRPGGHRPRAVRAGRRPRASRGGRRRGPVHLQAARADRSGSQEPRGTRGSRMRRPGCRPPSPRRARGRSTGHVGLVQQGGQAGVVDAPVRHDAWRSSCRALGDLTGLHTHQVEMHVRRKGRQGVDQDGETLARLVPAGCAPAAPCGADGSDRAAGRRSGCPPAPGRAARHTPARPTTRRSPRRERVGGVAPAGRGHGRRARWGCTCGRWRRRDRSRSGLRPLATSGTAGSWTWTMSLIAGTDRPACPVPRGRPQGDACDRAVGAHRRRPPASTGRADPRRGPRRGAALPRPRSRHHRGGRPLGIAAGASPVVRADQRDPHQARGGGGCATDLHPGGPRRGGPRVQARGLPARSAAVELMPPGGTGRASAARTGRRARCRRHPTPG